MKSKLQNAMISPRKMGLVVNLIKKMSVNGALQCLRVTHKKAAKLLYKCVYSAASNANKDFNLLAIDRIDVGRGQILSRWMPRARGNSNQIKKYCTNLGVYLKEISMELQAQIPIESQEVVNEVADEEEAK